MTTLTCDSETNASQMTKSLIAASRGFDSDDGDDVAPLAFPKIESVTVTVRHTWKPTADDIYDGNSGVSLTVTSNGAEIAVSSHQLDHGHAWKRVERFLNKDILQSYHRMIGVLLDDKL